MGKGLEILVLDDEPIVGDRLKPFLEGEGHRVEVFVDPKEALTRLKAKEFDIVLTDVRMENIDGIQVLERVRAKSDRTKVLMITGYATVELARQALSKGVFDFIAKPFKLEDIRAMVNKASEALLSEGV
jgi:DNA-binding NtrC family response regulator